MKIFQFTRSYKLALGFIAFSYFSTPVSALAKSLPFKATLNIVEQISSGSPQCTFIGTISGKGHATHMGKVTATSQDCINPIGPTSLFFYSNEPSRPDGALVLLAPNGSQVFVCYKGTFSTATDPAEINGRYQIIGGTGKFQGATGSGKLTGLEDISGGGAVPATGEIMLDGTIDSGVPSAYPDCLSFAKAPI